MPLSRSSIFRVAGGIIVFVLAGYLISGRFQADSGDNVIDKRTSVVPVEIAVVERGTLSFFKTFNGTIDPQAQFTVAPKVSGRIKRLLVDVSDPVHRGQVVVELENAEFEQEVMEAEARLAVAEANGDEALSHLEIARRQFDRAKTLNERGIASETSLDAARGQFLTASSAVKVAQANLKREQALVRAADIRLEYTKVKADWQQGDDQRTVARRFVDEGSTVAANTPILSIVEIDPVIAVIQVNEKDYPFIHLGQKAEIQATTFGDTNFTGVVSRISPVFEESSRQAEIEVEVANPEQLLKPGMFARCVLELDRVENAVSVPEMAISKRNNQIGVFRIVEASQTVEWIEVKPGFASGDRVQLMDTDLSGRVVTIGQRFVKDGSKVRIAAQTPAAETERGSN